LRVGHQRARDGEHLLFAARQVVAEVAPAFLKPREQRVGRAQVEAAGALADQQVLLDGKRREDVALLRHPGEPQFDAFVGRALAELTALPAQGAGKAARLAHEGEDERGLADAIAPEHGQAFARVDGQADVFDDDGVAITGGEAFDFKQHGYPAVRGRYP
jgi:hypothetical protein